MTDDIVQDRIQRVHDRIDALVVAMNTGFQSIATTMASQYRDVCVDVAILKERARHEDEIKPTKEAEYRSLKSLVASNLRFRWALGGAVALLAFMIPACIAATAIIVNLMNRSPGG